MFEKTGSAFLVKDSLNGKLEASPVLNAIPNDS